MKTCYSVNDEEFTLDSVAEVIDQINSDGEAKPGRVYYEADFVPLTVSDLISAQRILDEANEQGYDIIGEYWDMDFNVSPEARNVLQKLINAWANKHTNVTRYMKMQGSSRELKLVESDF